MTATIIKYNNFSPHRYDTRYNFLLRHFRPGNILDIGNIGGHFGQGSPRSSYLKFIELVGKNSTIYGFDLYNSPNPESYPLQEQGDIEDGLPYQNAFFDTVYMGELIEHLSDFKIVLGEISRVLKRDGKFILDTPNPYSLLRIMRYLFLRTENLGDPTHLVFFTPASIKSMLKKYNFVIEEMAEDFSDKSRYLPFCFTRGLGSHIMILAKKSL